MKSFGNSKKRKKNSRLTSIFTDLSSSRLILSWKGSKCCLLTRATKIFLPRLPKMLRILLLNTEKWLPVSSKILPKPDSPTRQGSELFGVWLRPSLMTSSKTCLGSILPKSWSSMLKIGLIWAKLLSYPFPGLSKNSLSYPKPKPSLSRIPEWLEKKEWEILLVVLSVLGSRFQSKVRLSDTERTKIAGFVTNARGKFTKVLSFCAN